MSTNALIKADGLNRFYGEYHAVKNFNLTLHKGEVLGLLGPNGAGKSTTMQMLTGNISPSSGSVVINGIDLLEEPKLAKSQIGYLPEQPPVYRDMTAREFLSYCTSLHDIPKNKANDAVNVALERCALNTVQNKLINNLSKGYQQRVGIAQAILHNPAVVILDEPTVGLDPIQITKIRELIKELGKDHSVILSTHILPEVQAVCDRVQIINHGETVFSDTFSQLTQKDSSICFVLGFDNALNDQDLQLLNSIDNLNKLSKLENNRYELVFNGGAQASNLYKMAVENGWILNEISHKKETLEQIFMKLIHTDVKSQAHTSESKGSTVDQGQAAQ